MTDMDGYFDPQRPETHTKLTIFDVVLMCTTLDEWHAAERRIYQRNHRGR